MELLWTDYMKYRAAVRGFDLAKIENIVRYSAERYFDIETGRRVVIGHHEKKLQLYQQARGYVPRGCYRTS